MPSRAPRAVLGLILCISVSAGAQVTSSGPKKAAPKTKTARQTSEQLERDISFDLLEDAYSTSRDLPSELRIPLLADICQHALMINLRGRGSFFVRRRSGSDTVKTVRVLDSNSAFAQLKKKQKEKLNDWAEELYSLGDEFPEASRERNVAVI